MESDSTHTVKMVMQETLTKADQALADKILAHCKHMATMDREYALYAWRRYMEELPWLGLDRIKKES